MPEPRGRIYELALRALDEQDRQVDDVRGRLAPVLAAGGVGLTLLTRPVFSGDHPSGAVELVATIVGLLGAVALVLAGAYVLHPRRLAFSVNARATLDAIRDRDAGTGTAAPRPPHHLVSGEPATSMSTCTCGGCSHPSGTSVIRVAISSSAKACRYICVVSTDRCPNRRRTQSSGSPKMRV
jgi:hypothetical protein